MLGSFSREILQDAERLLVDPKSHSVTGKGVNLRTALVVEDDAGVLAVVHAILNRGGFRVVTALSCDEAEHKVEECCGEVDVLIADILLPNSSGTEIALRAVRICPDIRVLFCSGSSTDSWPQSDIENLAQFPPGSYSFLPKPFTGQTLLREIGQLCAPTQKRLYYTAGT